ncbi:MAG TPA: PilZ domain-containing protein [Bryobacteraceae bacterium]
MDYPRKHPRFAIDTPAAVTLLGGDGASTKARVADLSESGLKIKLPKPVAVGETLRVEIAGDVFVGVVRNCDCKKGKSGGCLAGLELIHWIERARLQNLLDEFSVGTF